MHADAEPRTSYSMTVTENVTSTREDEGDDEVIESDELDEDLSHESDDLDENGLESDSADDDIADPEQDEEEDGDSSESSTTLANSLVIGTGAALVATFCVLL